MVPALAPFSSWPRGLVRECCPAGRPWTSTSLPRTSNRWSSQHLALFSSAPRLLYENMAYRWWISWTSFASLLQCNSRRERRPLTTTPRFPSSVPSSRLANGSRDTNLAFTLFSSSTSESDGQLSSPQPVLVIVAGSFACLSSPCAPLPVSSLPCLSSDTRSLWLKCIDGQLGPLTLLADSWFCPVRTW